MVGPEAASHLTDVSVKTRYSATEGMVFLTGVQAMIRVLVDQSRLDRAKGLHTAGLISGYPGSPLGGVDTEVARNRPVLEAADVYHQLGLNEELAATAIYGTQLIDSVPGARFDGVFGMWFGKAPGVDRAADAFHHANFHGVAKHGGVLAVAGDDPHARSTILPTDSNMIFASFYMPVIAPGNIQEVIDFGLHGYAMSRAAGLWVGFKLISDLADAFGTAQVGLGRVQPILPEVRFDGEILQPLFRPNEAGPPMIEREREVYYGRLEIARQYARLNGLNRIVAPVPAARRGIVAAGKTFYDLKEALFRLGYDDAALERAGIRLLKIGMVYPFDDALAREFAEGLEEILVVEDKRPFLEDFVKSALYGQPNPPRIVGKNDSDGSLLLTACGELSVDIIRRAVARWLGLPDEADALPAAPSALTERRTPYFCSGCPHNRSLRVPEGSVVGAGIGCHIMTLWMGPIMGEVTSYTQMGGEGAQWVGLHRFTDTEHFFQNLGDGTFAHSGSLAIRFAIAAGANITYKILYNSAVAMTGGQSVFGGKTVAGIVDELTAEGVAKIIVTTDEPERYRQIDLGSRATVRHRNELLDVERELAAVKGVTVLLNDQQCAAEKRRSRKRGQMARGKLKVLINERVCEGCGDCGVKSNCLSVEPVPTEFGRKTRINQATCNQDYSCLLGDCPSFMTIEGDAPEAASPDIALPDIDLPEPALVVPADDFSAVLAGIGGTGVVTVNQVLGMAAALAGKTVRGIDQIGSSQKAGPVVSHLRILDAARDGAARVGEGRADLLLAFDMLASSDAANLAVSSADRTVLIANEDAVPTGGTVTDPKRAYPEASLLKKRIGAVTRPGGLMIPALTLSRRVFGDEVSANLILVGAAYQAGALPLPLAAIEQAVRMNGVSVDANLRAIHWGRICVVAPELIDQLLAPADPAVVPADELDPSLERRIENLDLDDALLPRLRLRVAELIAFQDVALAERYLDRLNDLRVAEKRDRSLGTRLTEAVMVNLHKLLAYKDEYEVARLMVQHYERARLSGEIAGSQKVKWLLHPTFLRSLGVKEKVHLGKWFLPMARILARLKWLRGKPLDLFGMTEVRRVERRLIGEYEETLELIARRVGEADPALLLQLAGLPDMVRGYEDVKLGNVALYEEQRRQIIERLDQNFSEEKLKELSPV